MKDYKPLYDKAKELIEHLTKILYKSNYEIIEDNSKFLKMKSELHQLEAEIEKEEDENI
jgi:hypothetical protein